MRLDDQEILHIGTHGNIGSINPDLEGAATYANPNANRMSLFINHPYASDNGSFMDHSYNLNTVPMAMPMGIILSLGVSTNKLSANFSRERLNGAKNDIFIPICGRNVYDNPFTESLGLGTGVNVVWPTEDPQLLPLGYVWSSQFYKAAKIQARLSNARSQHHHSFGFVGISIEDDPACDLQKDNLDGEIVPDAPSFNSWQIVDQATIVDIVSGVSITNLNDNIEARNATHQAIALLGASLEGSIFEQRQDQPFTSSTTERFEWANENLSNDYFTISNTSTGTILIENTSTELLGPGAQDGPLRTSLEGVPVGFYVSRQRGGAKLSIAPDISSIGHLVTIHGTNGGVFKGGGASGPSLGEEGTGFNPAMAADILRDTFEDRSTLHGVDLSSGNFSYSPGADITTGSGDFPYALSFERSFSNGGLKSRGMGAGWQHNWDVQASLSGSAMEAMGERQALDAVASLVAMTAMQELYKGSNAPDAATLKRQITNFLVAHWWREHLQNNVVTIQQGPSSTQFVRLPSGEFNGPPGSTTTLIQTGTRVIDYVETQAIYPTSTKQRYYYENVGFEMHAASGDVLTFKHWNRVAQPTGRVTNLSYYTDVPAFLATNWTFASGYEIDFTYTPAANNAAETDNALRLIKVSNSDGRSLNFHYSYNSLNTDDNTVGEIGLKERLSSVTAETANASNIVQFGYSAMPLSMLDGTTELSNVTQTPENAHGPYLTSSINALGQITRYEYDYTHLNTATQRRQWYPHLKKMFSPQDPNTPVMEVEYDGAWRVKKLCDARANPDACQ